MVFSDIVYAVGILLSGLVLFCFVSIPRLRDFLLRTKQPHSATYRLGYYLPTSWTIFLSRNETKWKPISVNVFENGVLSVTHCRNSVSTTIVVELLHIARCQDCRLPPSVCHWQCKVRVNLDSLQGFYVNEPRLCQQNVIRNAVTMRRCYEIGLKTKDLTNSPPISD